MSRRIYYATEKPPKGAMLDSEHWAAKASGLWLFNEASGGIVEEYVNAASFTGLPQWTAGGVRFTGSYSLTASKAAPYVDGALSVVVRYKHDTSATGHRPLIAWGTVSMFPALYVHFATNARPLLYLANVDRLYRRWEPAAMLDGEYHTLALTMPEWSRDGLTASKFYVDGVAQAVVAENNTDVPATRTMLVLGQNSTGYLQGDVEMLSYYSEALTDDQVKSLHEAPYQAWYQSIPVYYSIPAGGPVIPIFAHHYAQLRAV
jgi:hypothetical protein